jgi:Mrp family chromosome partitioning ATPase
MSTDVIVSRIVELTAPPEPPPPTRALGEPSPHRVAPWSDATARTPWGRTAPRPVVELNHLIPDTREPSLAMLHDPMSHRARCYRLLSHRLMSRPEMRTIAVTSARPGEGKTTCALNLALALAEDTMTRVLVLEANLSRPAFGRILNFQPSSAFADKLTRSECPGPPYPVIALAGTRLHVAPLPLPLPTAARLDRTLFAVALADLRDAYDYIVIDSASALESGDVDVVGECANGVIVTARVGRSRSSDVRRAVTQLAPAPILGTVLIDA